MKYKGMYIAQQPAEFAAWKERVARIEPEAYLEIGSLRGGTLLMIAEALAPGATIISIDIQMCRKLTKSLGMLRQSGFTVHSIIENSAAPDIPGRIAALLGPYWLDAVFIDGDHSFDVAMSDYLMCLKLVRHGGLIGFHDIATLPLHGVAEVWGIVKAKHPNNTAEYIVDLPKKRPPGGSIGNGIGVVKV